MMNTHYNTLTYYIPIDYEFGIRIDFYGADSGFGG